MPASGCADAELPQARAEGLGGGSVPGNALFFEGTFLA